MKGYKYERKPETRKGVNGNGWKRRCFTRLC